MSLEQNCDLVFSSHAKDGRISTDAIREIFKKADIPANDLDKIFERALKELRVDHPAYQKNEKTFELSGWYLVLTILSEQTDIDLAAIIDSINGAYN